MISALRHAGLVVQDLESAIGFYEGLGLRLWRRETETGPFIEQVTGLSGVRLEWAKLKAPDDSLLELLQYHSHPANAPHEMAPAQAHGCSHVAFTVADVEATCARVKELGGTVTNPPALSSDKRVCVAYGHDVDGVLIELVEELS